VLWLAGQALKENQMVAKSETAIELPRLNIEILEVPIVGDTPLIVHAWSIKAKREMLGKQMKTAKLAKEAKDPVADFEASLYKLADGGYGFPSVGFKSAAVTACTSVGGITKVAARQAFHIMGEDNPVTGAFDGVLMRQNLVRIQGEPAMREDMVRVGMGTADLRYRGEFFPWFAKLHVRFNANVLSAAQIMNLLNTAGFATGVGEWRPERDGQYGLFHVAESGEVA
jgi:hypothetical protein